MRYTVVSQFEILAAFFFLYEPHGPGLSAFKAIKPTIHSKSRAVSHNPDSIAGVNFNDLWIFNEVLEHSVQGNYVRVISDLRAKVIS